jgi:hypothetical protein
LSEISVKERLQWSEARETTEEGDQTYCLLSIFDVHLPLIPAEGRENAMRRLLREIKERHKQSILAERKVSDITMIYHG